MPSNGVRLELLASSRHGANEELLASAVGCWRALSGASLRAAEREVVKAGGKTIEGVRVRITEEGRRALGGDPHHATPGPHGNGARLRSETGARRRLPR